jgi:predicted metalloprotease with PDZ domain
MNHFFTFAFSFCFILNGWSLWANDPQPDQYWIDFRMSQRDTVHVKAEIILEDSLLYMSSYGPMPERWPQFIRNLAVTDSLGRRIQVQESGQKGWHLKGTDKGQKMTLEYDLILEHEQLNWPGGIDGVAYKRDWGIMLSGRSLFVMNGKRKKDLRIAIDAPSNWKVSVPWKSIKSPDQTYQVRDLQALQESFIFTGTHQETKITRDGFTLKFVLGGAAVQEQQGRYVEVATGVMDYYIELMGGVPKPRPGQPMGECIVIISQSNSVDGEVIGNHLSMFMDPEGEPFTQMMGWFMFAHEFFHLWNGKSLIFSTNSTDWFKEGISNYYTIKALYQIGFASEEVILAMLDQLFYQRYIQDPGLGKLAPYDAAKGFDKDNHWGLIYGGGLFAGVAMDLEIRHQTANSASLDDLMRRFYRDFGGTTKTIDQTDILQGVNRLGPTDFTPFMQSYIEGTESLSLVSYLRLAGMDAQTSENHLQIKNRPEKTELEESLWQGFLGEN